MEKRRGIQHVASEEKYTVDEVELALAAGNGFASTAARALKCNPETVRSYIRRYPELQIVQHDASERWLDIAESELMKKVRRGDWQAIRFVLECKGKERGYVKRTETTGKDGGPIKFSDKKAEDMTDAELLQLIQKEPISA